MLAEANLDPSFCDLAHPPEPQETGGYFLSRRSRTKTEANIKHLIQTSRPSQLEIHKASARTVMEQLLEKFSQSANKRSLTSFP